MYKITQKETRKNWLGFNKTRLKVYTFEKYSEALIFALNEQIRYFSHCIEGKHSSTRDAYKQYHTVKNWVKIAANNPLHYIGVSSSKGINLERLYFYYLNSDNAHRLRKHI
tara:strand:- start:219 stop:551 length:333 start_codon:yes stop_codon:yes gene_type:complete